MRRIKLKAAPDARCPVCAALLLGMDGEESFVTYPPEQIIVDLFRDCFDMEVSVYTPAAVENFTATFVPCGCVWQARDKHGLQMYILWIVINDDGTCTFHLDHRQSGQEYVLYATKPHRKEDDHD